VVETARRPLGRAVSPDVSQFFHEAHARWGASILFSAAVAEIVGDEEGRVAGVETADGLRLPADLVVVGIGVVPNVELAAEAGLAADNGIVVDECSARPTRPSRRWATAPPSPAGSPTAAGAARVGAERGRPGQVRGGQARGKAGALRRRAVVLERPARPEAPDRGLTAATTSRSPAATSAPAGSRSSASAASGCSASSRSTGPATTWRGAGCSRRRAEPDPGAGADEGFDLKAHAAHAPRGPRADRRSPTAT
jgi:hypothetical protein